IPSAPLPVVRLELLHAAARPTTHVVADAGFLIGTVPGCDLRLPGAELPPVLCLITRDLTGVTLRKLAPVQSVLLNGRPVSQATLGDGDRVTVGAVQLRLSIEAMVAAIAPPVSQSVSEELQDKSRRLDARTQELEERARALVEERAN